MLHWFRSLHLGIYRIFSISNKIDTIHFIVRIIVFGTPIES
jgi:hypothetical protein